MNKYGKKKEKKPKKPQKHKIFREEFIQILNYFFTLNVFVFTYIYILYIYIVYIYIYWLKQIYLLFEKIRQDNIFINSNDVFIILDNYLKFANFSFFLFVNGFCELEFH